MLAIRMQRTGRKGHAQFRVIVQDSRFSAKSGRVVAYLGSYNPHTKSATIDGEKTSQYLDKGAQPSDRVAGLLKTEGIKLPSWVKVSEGKKRSIRNSDKLRRNRPAEEKPAETPKTEEPTAEQAEAEVTETATEEAPVKEPKAEPIEAKPEETKEKPAKPENTEKTEA